MNGSGIDPALELERQRVENARLIALLESHGIEWCLPPEPVVSIPEAVPSQLSTAEKVALFRRLFRGRIDLYSVRWENSTTGKSGYSPVCANERRHGICEKPRIKCADCNHRQMKPLSDQGVSCLSFSRPFGGLAASQQPKATKAAVEVCDSVALQPVAALKVRPLAEASDWPFSPRLRSGASSLLFWMRIHCSQDYRDPDSLFFAVVSRPMSAAALANIS